jgi:hypothetical protein
MKSVAEYQRLGDINAIVAAVKADAALEWKGVIEGADILRAAAVLEAERARTEVAAARSDGYDRGFKAGLEQSGAPRRRRGERDERGQLVAVVDEVQPALRVVHDRSDPELKALIDQLGQ